MRYFSHYCHRSYVLGKIYSVLILFHVLTVENNGNCFTTYKSKMYDYFLFSPRKSDFSSSLNWCQQVLVYQFPRTQPWWNPSHTSKIPDPDPRSGLFNLFVFSIVDWRTNFRCDTPVESKDFGFPPHVPCSQHLSIPFRNISNCLKYFATHLIDRATLNFHKAYRSSLKSSLKRNDPTDFKSLVWICNLPNTATKSATHNWKGL